MIFEEKKLDSERIYEGAILNVRRDRVTSVKGEAYREIIEHNGAVAMVPLTEEGKVLMVRQFRYACGRPVLEIPAGKIDKGAVAEQVRRNIRSPKRGALRRLREGKGSCP